MHDYLSFIALLVGIIVAIGLLITFLKSKSSLKPRSSEKDFLPEYYWYNCLSLSLLLMMLASLVFIYQPMFGLIQSQI